MSSACHRGRLFRRQRFGTSPPATSYPGRPGGGSGHHWLPGPVFHHCVVVPDFHARRLVLRAEHPRLARGPVRGVRHRRQMTATPAPPPGDDTARVRRSGTDPGTDQQRTCGAFGAAVGVGREGGHQGDLPRGVRRHSRSVPGLPELRAVHRSRSLHGIRGRHRLRHLGLQPCRVRGPQATGNPGHLRTFDEGLDAGGSCWDAVGHVREERRPAPAEDETLAAVAAGIFLSTVSLVLHTDGHDKRTEPEEPTSSASAQPH